MLIKQSLRLVHSGSVTQANMKLATVNNGSMIDIGVDWSAYAGNDAGNTPHMLVLYDSAGKRMQGFIGASGGGEALGAELLSNNDFSGTWGANDVPEDWALWGTVNGSNYLTKDDVNNRLQITTDGSAIGIIKTGVVVSTNMLAKIVWDIETFTSGQGQVNAGVSIVESTAGLKTAYRVPVGMNFYLIRVSGQAGNFITNSVSIKRVTDVSVQGVHLHSTRGGTNRNVASIDSGFDLNDGSGYTFKLYKCP